MLPVESFADVVSFLGYYDLGALKLANKLCSDVSVECASAIRLFDFSDNNFFINDNVIGFSHTRSEEWSESASLFPICELELPAGTTVAEFVAEAFRNCTVGRLTLGKRRKDSVDHVRSIKDIANTNAVRTLNIGSDVFEDVQDLVEFIDSFRRVEALTRWSWRSSTREEMQVLQDFCRRKNIDF